jgi:prophage DNA circulation protein
MSRLTGLLPASWRGISFLVKNEVLAEGGRRIVLHDYPNSNTRFVEDQGELPPKFSITAFVTGADFIDRAEQLERALREKGKGSLSMPTFGSRILFAMPYKKDASQTAVGEIRFELSFVAGTAVSGPIRGFPNSETVYAQGDDARQAINTSVDDLWQVPSNSPNVLSAEFDLQEMTAAVRGITSATNNAGDINTLADLIDQNTPNIVRDSGDMASAIIDLWQSVSVGLTGGAGLSQLLELTSFGSQLSLSLSDIKNANTPDTDDSDSDEIPLWAATTASRIKRNQNRLSTVNACRVAALVSAYEQAADATYGTDTEIEETRLNLEVAHQRLMRVDTSDKTLIQSQPGVRASVELIRLTALRVLDEKEQSVFSLTTICNPVAISSFVQGYTLYAESITTSEDATTKGLEIRALNPTQPADKLIGETTVLQA